MSFLAALQRRPDVLRNLDGVHAILLPLLSSLSRIWTIFNHVQGFNYYLCKDGSRICLFSPNIFTRAYIRVFDCILTSSLGASNVVCQHAESIVLTPEDLPIPHAC